MFAHGLTQNQIIDNDTLVDIFKCSPQGGMRRSRQTGTLVIVSNHIKSLYDDRWIDGILHYTGMGREGNQDFSETQNKTVFESDTNGIEIHYFEVFQDKEYTYVGQMILADKPYMENQLDDNNANRLVCVFPLKLLGGNIPLLQSNVKERIFQAKEKIASKLSDDDLRVKAENAAKKPGTRDVVTTQYDRDIYVVAFAKRSANGLCQLCGTPAPFNSSNGEPYLEVHHIVWLSKGGLDAIENAVALCPNCHRKMHVKNNENDIQLLISIAKSLAKIP